MSPLLIAISLTAPVQAGQGIALRGGIWEVFCTGGEMMEITWFDDPASAWTYVQGECGGIADITGLELKVTTGRSDEPGQGPALFLARNGLDYWPGANGVLLMSDMEGIEGNLTPSRTGTGQALDTFILGPPHPEKVGPGRVLLVLDPALYDDVMTQFGPCVPGLGVTCVGRLDLRTFYEMAGIKLTVQPDDRWIRSQEPSKRHQWTAHPHTAWLTPPPLMDGIERPPGKEHTDRIALDEALTTSHQDGWAGMVSVQ